MWIKLVFIASGIYDAVLGIAFLLFGSQVLAHFGVTPPNSMAYLHFPALLLILFAIMYFRIAGDPQGRRELIPYGMGLKLSYATVVFWYQFHGGIPVLWLPFAWADLAFLLLFFAVWKNLRRV